MIQTKYVKLVVEAIVAVIENLALSLSRPRECDKTHDSSQIDKTLHSVQGRGTIQVGVFSSLVQNATQCDSVTKRYTNKNKK